MSQFQRRFTHSFANQKPRDFVQSLGGCRVYQLQQVMHALVTGQYREGWERTFHQAIKGRLIAGWQLAPVYLAIVNFRAASGQFITEQIATLLTAKNHNAFTRDLLQGFGLEQCFTVIGFAYNQALVQVLDPIGECMTGRSTDHTTGGIGCKPCRIDKLKRPINRIATDKYQNIVLPDVLVQTLPQGIVFSQYDFDYRK
jgi:hypothetical protein